MNILMLGNKTMNITKLPSRVEGSFFLTDPITNENLMLIESNGLNWSIFSTSEAKLLDRTNTLIEKTNIYNNECFWVLNESKKNIIYCQEAFDTTFKMYKINCDGVINISSADDANIIYNFKFFENFHITLTLEKGIWTLSNISDYIYLNNKLVQGETVKIKNGDRLFIFGLQLIFINGFVFVNNPSNLVKMNTTVLTPVVINEKEVPYTEVKEQDFYKDDDYYFNTPRIRRFINEYKLNVANPPAKVTQEEMPLILTLGPMLTMALMSVITLINVVSQIVGGQTTLSRSWPSLLSAVIMMSTSLLWPNITRAYQKKQTKKKEALRKEKYLAYLQLKRKEIIQETINQTAILKENLLPLSDYVEMIMNKKRVLWERKITQKDFLTVRVGIGDIPMDMQVQFSKDEFAIELDEMKEVASAMVDEAKMLHQVPIRFSFYGKQATAIMGDYKLTKNFTDNILLQLIACHSYDELKIVIFTNEDNKSDWDAYKSLPHLFSDDKQVRFMASDYEYAKELSYYLENEIINRAQSQSGESEDGTPEPSANHKPYYLILTDDYKKIRKLGICEKVFGINQNLGFSFIILDRRLSRLPDKCTNFIMLQNVQSSILTNDGQNYSQVVFKNEIDDTINMEECVASLSNLPIEFIQDIRYLPTNLTFLEMYNVGKVEQLNIVNRWKINDPTKSLRAPLGVNDQSNLIMLDLHEKYHGPHGLIAGTTGSGKSEFIITYILSMAVNYSPNEVAFILIDYKGGGLAGAFENKKNNIRLPHLAGTITNLDKNELNRTLVSIQSELHRRQAVFNVARDQLGESTIDIYKYQKFFREGRLQEPMPHLFIICDEFAELKAQQPDFMDNLISAARIGRSLGIHLILATQKPSGVVNDQIWSNTKFRVCLKVATPGDSNEVIKCPDAATIKNAGRFYLQVGTNELFILGQSAWGGAQYTPSDVIKKEYDRSISIINESGSVIKNLSAESNVKKISAEGDELSNVVKYISTLAGKERVKAKNLWLDSISPIIHLNELIEKYKFKSNETTAIIGEYDVPSSQYQNILTLPLNENSNTLIFGQSGQNREMFIRTLIYSASKLYSSEKVNFYVMDFGSETFKIFNKLPHVGDVVFAHEAEKIDKLFKMIDSEITERKKMFVDYNGDYSNYCKNSGNTVPLMITIINNYESFKEIYGAYEEFLLRLSREGKRYGIIFMLATNSRSGIYSRFLKNFDNTFVLDMNDRDEYIDILGRIGNVYPADYPGRGLCKKEMICEFQTLQICDEEKIVEFIKEEGTKISEVNSYNAKPIPILPEVIKLEDLESSIDNATNIPIGLNKETLNPYKYNFKADKANIICANDISSCNNFLLGLTKIFKKINNIMTIFFDLEKSCENLKEYVNSYCNSDFEKFLDQITNFINTKVKDSKYDLMLIISGVEKFASNIPSSKIENFMKMVSNIPNVNIIYADDVFKMKKIIFEPWFSDYTVNANGIWIGSGVADQTVLRTMLYSNALNAPLRNDFAWIFKNSELYLIKLINEGEQNEEQSTN